MKPSVLLATILLLLPTYIIAQDMTFTDECANSKDFYQMTPTQLNQQIFSCIEKEVSLLRARNAADQKQLEQTLAFNYQMCQRLETLRNNCVGQEFVIPDDGLMNLGCNGISKAQAPTQINVNFDATGGACFRLQVNTVYVTDPLCNPTNDGVVFTKASGSKAIQALRFREITTLEVVAVKSTSKLINSVITDRIPRPDKTRMQIFVDGNPLIGGKDDWIKLLPPDDPGNLSTYRVNTLSLVTLGSDPACMLTQGQIDQLRIQAMTNQAAMSAAVQDAAYYKKEHP